MWPGYREIKLAADSQWGADVYILRPTPTNGDHWGALAPLRGTVWEACVMDLGGDLLSHALHGHRMPLLRAMKLTPMAGLRKVAEQQCALKAGRQCLGAGKNCHPCEKLPECYVAPELTGPAGRAASVVALALSKGYHVVAFTEQDEFVL